MSGCKGRRGYGSDIFESLAQKLKCLQYNSAHFSADDGDDVVRQQQQMMVKMRGSEGAVKMSSGPVSSFGSGSSVRLELYDGAVCHGVGSSKEILRD